MLFSDLLFGAISGGRWACWGVSGQGLIAFIILYLSLRVLYPRPDGF